MASRKDVAALAGVSEVTVSRVFSKNGAVSEKRETAVKAAAEKLGYKPSPIAISFKSNSTKQILMLLPKQDLENSYFIALYKGAAGYAEDAGYLLAISTDMMFSRISKKMFDGIILANASFPVGELKENLRVPATVLSFGEEIFYPWLENVVVDTGQAMEMIISHLNSLGHSRIAYAMPRHTLMSGTHSARYDRYISLLTDVFHENVHDYIFGIDPAEAKGDLINYFHYGRVAADQIYAGKPDITAVACFNDEVALGLIGRLQNLGIKVPGDISVVGIDDILQSEYSVPSLTTVRLPAARQGVESIRKLINQIEGEDPAKKIELNLEIIARESVSPLKT